MGVRRWRDQPVHSSIYCSSVSFSKIHYLPMFFVVGLAVQIGRASIVAADTPQACVVGTPNGIQSAQEIVMLTSPGTPPGKPTIW
jgi:hypothetical protein